MQTGLNDIKAAVARVASIPARHVFLALLGSLTCAAMLVAPAQATAAPTVDNATLLVPTSEGRVHGIAGQGVREFKGIPFAAPPVGELRFETGHSKW